MWRLLLVISVVVIGIYMCVAYKTLFPCGDLTPHDAQEKERERRRYRVMRYIGIALVIIGAVLGVYFYYTKQIKFRARMPNDCKACRLYINRHRGLRPYSVDEYRMLKQHAAACKLCSDMCFDMVQILDRDPTVKQSERLSAKQDCADTTKHAILAKKELERLGSKIQSTRTRLWHAAKTVGAEPTWDPFPTVK